MLVGGLLFVTAVLGFFGGRRLVRLYWQVRAVEVVDLFVCGAPALLPLVLSLLVACCVSGGELAKVCICYCDLLVQLLTVSSSSSYRER